MQALATFNNNWYKPGSRIKILIWMLVQAIFFNHSLAVGYDLKIRLLKLFGATIGKGVIIKPNVQIKYPWLLTVGDYSWIGEYVWIDNLAKVTIEDNVCISQGAYLLTGNHNYKKTTFDLIVKPIIIRQGAWIGAKSIVCPGVTVHSNAILTVGSVATSNLEQDGIYQGNPAELIRKRKLE
ncbi:MAG: WcaF family extracellular polysaccharide biosynthesis acetyltransferase [Chitinophagaceae bacterium]